MIIHDRSTVPWLGGTTPTLTVRSSSPAAVQQTNTRHSPIVVSEDPGLESYMYTKNIYTSGMCSNVLPVPIKNNSSSPDGLGGLLALTLAIF